MYCSGCGTFISDKLNYCKNCGAKLAKQKDKSSTEPILESILTTLFLVVLFGLGILVGLVAVLLKNDVAQQVVVMIAIVYLAAVFGICYMLLSQIPKLINAELKSDNEMPESYQPPQISAKNTAQLEEHREPVMSVTDHTTRTFDKIPLKEN